MNGDQYANPSSSTSKTMVYDPKPSFLSTYLATNADELNQADTYSKSDAHDEESKSKRFKENERIEILAPRFTMIRQDDSLTIQPPCDNICPPSNTDSTDLNYKKSDNHHYNSSIDESYVNIWNDNLIESSTPRRAQYRVIFEVIKARSTTKPDRQRYVNYTILMKRVPGLEIEPAIIERRYTDFRNFFNAIKRKHSSLLKDVIFPKKIFIGNFSTEVIAERSMAFQKFLTYCLSLSEIRTSKEFAAFLYYPELREAKNLLKSIRLEEAAGIFENVYYIQSKLTFQNGKPDAQLIHTLCCLIGCLNAVDNTAEARKMANKTFELLFENPIVVTSNLNSPNNTIYEVDDLYEISSLVLPLILLSLRHGWFVGRQKVVLESKVEELCRKHSIPRNYESHPKLLELMLRKDFSPII